MSLALFWIEVQKLLKRRLFLILLGLMLGLELLLFFGGALLFNVLGNPQMLKASLTFPGGLSLGIALSSNLGGLFLLILAADVANSEYQWRTLHLYLSQGISRVMLVSVRILALIVPALLFVLAPLLLAVVSTLILTPLLGGSFDLAAIQWGSFWVNVARTVLYLVPFSTFAFMLGVLTRSMAVTIIFSLLYVFIAEPVLKSMGDFFGQRLGEITPYLPFQLTNALLGQGGEGVMIAPDESIIPVMALDPNIAGFGVLVWVGFFWLLSLVVLLQQDLTT
ncbi:ABC transporter permease subunit [Spirulina subsalsa FACHB-351]|uniref:ABC transporter permease subunit n=1 Tax=Spirulina subsalsa FACHB-351 TaxID=234711 RepID=A0ABT3KZV9_9CYAN|nr:ABC transporter permease subunit [Spirulina subsalsa]MCW6034783.1 ABC transporter permease subunit [Spirulina subsalsa FACHB-351]